MKFELLAESAHDARRELERFLIRLQQIQPETIAINRQLMKAGKIEFDEYEEVL